MVDVPELQIAMIWSFVVVDSDNNDIFSFFFPYMVDSKSCLDSFILKI